MAYFYATSRIGSESVNPDYNIGFPSVFCTSVPNQAGSTRCRTRGWRRLQQRRKTSDGYLSSRSPDKAYPSGNSGEEGRESSENCGDQHSERRALGCGLVKH